MEKRRQTFILTSGLYSQHGDEVGPGVPGALPPMPETSRTLLKLPKTSSVKIPLTPTSPVPTFVGAATTPSVPKTDY